MCLHIFCRYACRGLFEMHKLLFSFQMCAKILEVAGKLNMDEYSFFLRGGLVRKHTITLIWDRTDTDSFMFWVLGLFVDTLIYPTDQ